MDGLVYILNGNKKRAVLNSPFNSTRSEAFSAYFHLSGFTAADIYFDILKINVPAPLAMTVRVAYIVTRRGTSPAGIADFSHS